MYNNAHFETENKQYSAISGAIVLKPPECSCLVPVMGVTRLDTHQRSPAVWYQTDNAIFGAQHIAHISNCTSPPGCNVQYTKVNGRRGEKHTHTETPSALQLISGGRWCLGASHRWPPTLPRQRPAAQIKNCPHLSIWPTWLDIWTTWKHCLKLHR